MKYELLFVNSLSPPIFDSDLAEQAGEQGSLTHRYKEYGIDIAPFNSPVYTYMYVYTCVCDIHVDV